MEDDSIPSAATLSFVKVTTPLLTRQLLLRSARSRFEVTVVAGGADVGVCCAGTSKDISRARTNPLQKGILRIVFINYFPENS